MRWITRVALTVPLFILTSCGGVTTTGGGGSVPDTNPPEAPAALQKVYTEHLGSLIGTVQYSSEAVGLIGTDLGSSFERDGKLVFLFGDGWTSDPSYFDGDPAAWVDPAANPLVTGEIPEFHWYLESTGQFLPLRVPGIDMGPFNVPLDGVPIGSDTYIFVATGFLDQSPELVLARTDGLALDSLSLESETAAGKFLNVSVVQDGGYLWIFGSGTNYRQSAVYLARVQPSLVTDRSAWSYFRGYEQGAPAFGSTESNAAPIVSAACVGELSVRHHEGLGYLMTYNCDSPRGIVLRFAEQLAGPWSAGTVIFQPSLDRGYGYFMHQRESEVNYDDGLSDPGRTDDWGGEYGPYMVPKWTTMEDPGVFSIVYTLSSWNPYKAHLMRTIIAEPGVTVSAPPERGTTLPRANFENKDFATGDLSGWQTSGDSFAVYSGNGGQWLTTNNPLQGGIAVQGEAWQDFSIDAKTHELRFTVSGGDAASVKLQLLRGGVVIDTVRESWGRRSDMIETPVRWLLNDMHGETVRLLIEDHSADEWGYVTTSGFTFVQDP